MAFFVIYIACADNGSFSFFTNTVEMAAKNLSRDDVLDVMDDQSDGDAGGISSAEEEDLV